MNWQAYWNAATEVTELGDLLGQVGKTVGGTPITQSQLDTLVAQIAEGLQLTPTDGVLDLCCGNGVLTARIAVACREVLGVDYSAPLIRTAQRFHTRPNVRYLCQSVLDITPSALEGASPFDKVYLYEALQHFSPAQYGPLLDTIASVSSPRFIAYFGSIPDEDRLWQFYNTPERVAEYHRRIAEGREAIGTWWNRQYLASQAAAHGFACEFIDQDPSLHTAHYRFDMRLVTRLPGDQS